MRGQALLEGGKPAEAIAPLRKAVQLSNNAPLIEMLLGQALVGTDNKAYTEEAITILRAAVARETEAPLGYTQLAMAYGRKGDYAQADLASAQAAYPSRRQQDRARTRLARKNPFRRSARPDGSRPTTSSPQSRCPARRATRNKLSRRTKFSKPAFSQEDLPMPSFRLLAPALLALALCGTPPAASAQSFSDSQRGDIETIVRNYLLAHPEVLEEAMAELSKRQAAAEAEKHEASVATNAETIFNSPRGVTLGNKDGDVTFVEFFDYNCGYCKRAMADMLDLMKTDPKLKVVLKEFPVLSQGSVEAAQVAVAVRMQDPDRQEISRFPPEAARRPRSGRQGARDGGRQGGRPRYRPGSRRISQARKCAPRIEENFKLAEAMGMNGTPSYVIGKQVVIGAVGLDSLKEKIGIARCGKATC